MMKAKKKADQTEKKMVEQYIHHLAAIVESSEDSIISISLDGVIKSWNKSSAKMFGYTSDEMIGKNISLLIPSESINEEKNILERVSNNEIIDSYEAVRIEKSGRQFYVSLTVSPLKNRAGSIIGVSKIARDITVRKKTETALVIANKELAFQNEEKEKRAAELLLANKELLFQTELKAKRDKELVIANKELVFQNEEKEKRAAELLLANKELLFENKEKERRAAELVAVNHELSIAESSIREVNKELEAFSYSVAHDLRSPVRAMHGYATILEEDYHAKLDDEGKRLISEITYNAKAIGNLIDDLLTFSMLGRKEITKSTINMTQLTLSTLEDLKLAGIYSPYVKVGKLLSVTADAALMKHVMTNLISNAIKYSSKKEKAIIEINSKKEKGMITYSVKDNGVGFGMEYADKLFGVFQRLHSDEEFEGTGVGLAIVQRIILRHGGKVWAEARENEGATFYFSLPDTN